MNTQVQRSKEELLKDMYERSTVQGYLGILVEVMIDIRNRLTDIADYEYETDNI